MALFARLKTAAAEDWQRYVQHEFVRQLGDGSLPEAAFRTYLVQDFLFMIQHARAWALAAYKARTLADLRMAKDTLASIMDIEMGLHLRVCKRWGLETGDVEATPEHPATIAYTRYVLDVGMSGDFLDLQVALTPCSLGYAEIGRRLAPQGVGALDLAHPYYEWISEFAGDAYQQMAAEAQRRLDALGQHYAYEHRLDELTRIFATAARLEADFWQMGLDVVK